MEQDHILGPPFLEAGGIGDMILALLCCSLRCPGLVLAFGKVRTYICEWVLGKEVFVPLHLLMPAIVLCLFQQHPEVLIFLLKRGEESLWGTVPYPLWCLRSHGIPVCVETLGLWVLATPSNTQINISLSFPETSAH